MRAVPHFETIPQCTELPSFGFPYRFVDRIERLYDAFGVFLQRFGELFVRRFRGIIEVLNPGPDDLSHRLDERTRIRRIGVLVGEFVDVAAELHRRLHAVLLVVEGGNIVRQNDRTGRDDDRDE